MKIILILLSFCLSKFCYSQYKAKVKLYDLKGNGIHYGVIFNPDISQSFYPDSSGMFIINSNAIMQKIIISVPGFKTDTVMIHCTDDNIVHKITLKENLQHLPVFEIKSDKSGNQNENYFSEIINPKLWQRNLSPSFTETIHKISGFKYQITCNVCYAGELTLFGLSSGYYQIFIDEIPVFKGLSSVYAIQNFPVQTVSKAEIIYGPDDGTMGIQSIAGSLYLHTGDSLNVNNMLQTRISSSGELKVNIFLKPSRKNIWFNADFSTMDIRWDKNKDGFLDIPLYKRFNFWLKNSVNTKQGNVDIISNVALENRIGGQKNYTAKNKGSDSIYGEFVNYYSVFSGVKWIPKSIKYSKILFSLNHYSHNAIYGLNPFHAQQNNIYGIFEKSLFYKKHQTKFVLNPSIMTYHDIYLPETQFEMQTGMAVRHSTKLLSNSTISITSRMDYHNIHGWIFSPRLLFNSKIFGNKNEMTLHAGRSFRTIQFASESHAALTGSRKFFIVKPLQPEIALAAQLSFKRTFKFKNSIISTGIHGYTAQIQNKILLDYDMNGQKIIFRNDSTNLRLKNLIFFFKAEMAQWEINLDALWNHHFLKNGNESEKLFFMEKYNVNVSVSREFVQKGLSTRLNLKTIGPMRMPLAGIYDPRPEFSPVWNTLDFMLEKNTSFGLIYLIVENLFDYNPAHKLPFLIARFHDPFDKDVQTDDQGNVVVTKENPYGLTFDTTYSYAPNWGRLFRIGWKFIW